MKKTLIALAVAAVLGVGTFGILHKTPVEVAKQGGGGDPPACPPCK